MQKNCLFECLNVTCFALFLLQMGFLINNHLHPDETISHTEQKRLSENSLATIYRVCIKPIMQLYFACEYIITSIYIVFPAKVVGHLLPRRLSHLHQAGLRPGCSLGGRILQQLAIFCGFVHIVSRIDCSLSLDRKIGCFLLLLIFLLRLRQIF